MKLTLLTGAGISTAAGIPDFRGPQGVWTRDPEAERTSTLSWYLGDRAVRERAWRQRAEAAVWEKEPTDAHRAIAEAARIHETEIITQNVDGLHQAAGSAPSSVHEVHGSARTWRCEDCGAAGPMEEAMCRVAAGETDPPCPHCDGIIRAATILFEEVLEPAVIDAAIAAAERCDVMIAVGTGLTVHPVAGLFPLARDQGARAFVVNAEPTPYDDLAEETLRGDLQEELPALLARL
ncbi:SIR2 family NAD-dependent protein deacylase [Brevibacterium album]|uniref:SIR2 family NAD-dependent protein deacylase n=1 Tax=Brevibacterium album TaxID=417948 RepID=UPI000410A6AF|nr:Sir2 family NAD-dependent protein deacetylase [Brevibacterium album]